MWLKITSNMMVSQLVIRFAWRHKQPIFFSKTPGQGPIYKFDTHYGHKKTKMYYFSNLIKIVTVSLNKHQYLTCRKLNMDEIVHQNNDLGIE